MFACTLRREGSGASTTSPLSLYPFLGLSFPVLNPTGLLHANCVSRNRSRPRLGVCMLTFWVIINSSSGWTEKDCLNSQPLLLALELQTSLAHRYFPSQALFNWIPSGSVMSGQKRSRGRSSCHLPRWPGGIFSSYRVPAERGHCQLRNAAFDGSGLFLPLQRNLFPWRGRWKGPPRQAGFSGI